MTRGYNHRNSWFPYEKWWFSIVNYSLPEGIYQGVKKTGIVTMTSWELSPVSPETVAVSTGLLLHGGFTTQKSFPKLWFKICQNNVWNIECFNTPKGVIIGDVLSYSPYIPYWCCTSIIVNNAPLMLLYPHFFLCCKCKPSQSIPKLVYLKESQFLMVKSPFWWLNPLFDG